MGKIVGHFLSDSNSKNGTSISGEPLKEIKWNQVQKLDMETGYIPENFAETLKSKIKLPGFAVQLESSFKPTRKFLFVPNQAYCIHVPPPPPNLMILVESKKVMELEDLQGPLWIEGKLKIESTNSKYGIAGWYLKADSIYEYLWEDEQK